MWLISCILFVFVALLEYFVVLFAMRYDKNWRRSGGAGAGAGLPRSSRASGAGTRGSISAASVSLMQQAAAAHAGGGGLPSNTGASEGGGSRLNSPRRGSVARLTLPSINHFHAALATPEDDTGATSRPLPRTILCHIKYHTKNII